MIHDDSMLDAAQQPDAADLPLDLEWEAELERRMAGLKSDEAETICNELLNISQPQGSRIRSVDPRDTTYERFDGDPPRVPQVADQHFQVIIRVLQLVKAEP